MSDQPFDRRLVLHIGAPKTGTSALQSAFVRNRQALSEAGVRYPETRSDSAAMVGRITSGNGVAIAGFLNERLSFAARCGGIELASFLQSVRESIEPITLYSCEHMSFFDEEKLLLLATEASRNGIEIEVVYFVRDLIPHAVSAYSQQLKRHRSTLSFREFAKRYRPRFGATLTKLVALFGRKKLLLLSYDQTKGTLLRSALAAMRVRHDSVEETTGRINRSLTAVESEIMRLINRGSLSNRQCREISDALLYSKPEAHSPSFVDEEVYAFFCAKFRAEVDLVNMLASGSLISIGECPAHQNGTAIESARIAELAGSMDQLPISRKGKIALRECLSTVSHRSSLPSS